MRIKEFFNKKINVALVTAVLIMIAILTICVATSHSKYVLEKELTFSLGIIESDEWNKRTLIIGEELNEILKDTGATQVVFGFEEDFLTEIENIEGTVVGVADEKKSFMADDIKLYTVNDTENNIITAYILSEYQIKANANSSKMFYFDNNEALTNIYFLNFETSIVENMESMFEGCENLAELDLSKFETAKVTNISRMFYDCNSLETIYASELWDISRIETAQDNVFFNCVNLKVENGTAYDEENPITTSDYARIDRAADGETPAIPGYFTYKSSVTEEQVTFNIVRPSTTEKTDTEDTTTTSNTTNEANTNIDDTKKETETGTENKDKTEADTESDNIDSNGDTSLDDNVDSNNSNNTSEELDEDKEKVEDYKDVEDEKIEETIGEDTEDR